MDINKEEYTDFLKKGDFIEALKLQDKAIKINPNNPHPFFVKARVFYNQENYDKAREYYEKVINSDKEYPNANIVFKESYVELAKIHSNKGMFDKSIDYLLKALLVYPKDYIVQSELSLM